MFSNEKSPILSRKRPRSVLCIAEAFAAVEAAALALEDVCHQSFRLPTRCGIHDQSGRCTPSSALSSSLGVDSMIGDLLIVV